MEPSQTYSPPLVGTERSSTLPEVTREEVWRHFKQHPFAIRFWEIAREAIVWVLVLLASRRVADIPPVILAAVGLALFLAGQAWRVYARAERDILRGRLRESNAQRDAAERTVVRQTGEITRLQSLPATETPRLNLHLDTIYMVDCGYVPDSLQWDGACWAAEIHGVRITNRSSTERVSLRFMLIIPLLKPTAQMTRITVSLRFSGEPPENGKFLGEPLGIAAQDATIEASLYFRTFLQIINYVGGNAALDLSHCALEIQDTVSLASVSFPLPPFMPVREPPPA